MSDLINHEVLAVSRLATQYTEAANFISFVKGLLSEADTLEEVYQNIITERWLDNAEGVQLDILGAIVGQPRVLYDITPLSWFGFVGGVIADSFGDLNDDSVGSRFRSVGSPTGGTIHLEDTEYALFIRGKIAKNHSDTSAESVKTQLRTMFNTTIIDVRDLSPARALISIGTLLDSNTKHLIKNAGLIPKAIGVDYIYSEFEAGNQFGFFGTPESKGFSDLSTPTEGGKFASLF